jgi:hypothetical protein
MAAISTNRGFPGMATLTSIPRLSIWKLILGFGVLQTECRMHWAEQVLAFITNRIERRKE